MRQSSTAIRKSIMIFASLLISSSGLTEIYGQERLGRPLSPGATLVGGGGGSQIVPAGTVLTISIDSALSSKTAQVGDRFRGSTIKPVISGSGRTLIPAGSVIEGRVSDVESAKRARKSGTLSLAFERIRLPNGRTFVLRGTLRNAGGRDRKRVDDEGDLKGNGTKKESGIIVGGGAGSGALIGAAAGGAAAGLGIGAAAGVGIALLRKGKEAEVKPGQRFGLELSQSIRLTSPPPKVYADQSIGVPRIIRPRPRTTQGIYTPVYTRPTPYERASTSTYTGGAGTLSVVDADANRMSDGYVRISITAQIQSNRRIYTHYQVSGNTVNVRLYGGPASTSANTYPSAQPAPIINVEDKNRRLRTVQIYGKDGVRHVDIDRRFADATYREPSRDPYTPPVTTRPRPRPTTQPPSNRPRPTPRPTNPPSSTRSPRQLLGDIETLREDYAWSAGIELNRDGSINNRSSGDSTAEQRRVVEDLSSLYKSVNSYNTSPSATNANRVRVNTNDLQQAWRGVRMAQDHNQRFLQIFSSSRALVSRYQDTSDRRPVDDRDNRIPDDDDNRNRDRDNDNEVIADVPVTGNLAQQARNTRTQIFSFFATYGSRLQLWVNDDGSYDVNGTRSPSQNETRFLQSISNLLNSARGLETNPGASTRRNHALRLKQESDKLENLWPEVRKSNEDNARFNRMIQSSKALAQLAST